MNRLVQYKAPWCKPCGAISALVDKYADRYIIDVRDIENEDIMAEAVANKVKSVPTVIIYDDNYIELARFTGTEQINKNNLDKYAND